MQSARKHSCLPKVIALYIFLYAASQELPRVIDYLSSGFTNVDSRTLLIFRSAGYAQEAILLLWLPLSYFVWRRRMWARWLVGYSALLLGTVQCVAWVDTPMRYGSALVNEMFLFALPSFFLSAVVFCPTVGQSFAGNDHSVNE